MGMNASPGAAVGKAVFDSAEAVRLAAEGEDVILVRRETNPDDLAGGARPWSPGRREDDAQMERAAARGAERLWCMSEVDIFCDLDEAEMGALSQAAPMRRYGSGELVYTQSKTCCWNSSTSAMAELIVAKATADKEAADARELLDAENEASGEEQT